jgi:hypothetical protein
MLAVGSSMSSGIAQDNITLDRVFWVSPPKWYLLRQAALLDNVLWFRKYSFPVIDGKQQTGIDEIKNIISYGCQRSSRTLDFVVFHLPTWIHLNTIDTNGWISQLVLRIAIDRLSFTAVGEYRNRELFIDLNDDFRDHLLKLLISEQIVVEFGPKNERITVNQMYRTPTGGNVVGYLDEMVPHVSSLLKGGKVESLETEAMLQKCLVFKKNGRY